MTNDTEMSCANCRRSHKDEYCAYSYIVKTGGIPICAAWAPKLARGEKLRSSCFECTIFDALEYSCGIGGHIFCPSDHLCSHFNPYKTSPLLKRKKNEPPYLPGLEK